MSRIARLQALVAVGGLVAGVAVFLLVVASNHEPTPNGVMALFVLIGWMFIGTGLVAWRRRPDSRFGILFVTVGFAWAAAGLSEANNETVFSLALLVDSVWVAALIHALLAFPNGRLESRLSRVVVVGFYAWATVLQASVVLTSRSDQIGDCKASGRCIENVLLVTSSSALHTAVETTFGAVGAALALATLIVLIGRWQGASPPLRRTLGPVFGAGVAFVVMAVLILVAQITFGLSDTLAQVLLLTTFGVLPFAFLGGLVRGRLAHSAVSRLVVELREHPGGGGVRDALARTLRDPSLDLIYWIPDAGGYVGATGRTVDPALEPHRVTTVVEHGGDRIAALVHDPSLRDDPGLVDAACAAAGIALTNERLQAELRRRVDELRASRARIVEAGDAERRRLERNLHDGAQQRLVSLALSIRLAEATVRRDPVEAERILGAASEELAAALTELREIARGIHPGVLSDRGLQPALQALADREPLPVELDCDLSSRLPQAVEAAAYYVVAEALTNVAKYADASLATVHVGREDGHLTVRVADDGVGGADTTRGTGLRGLRDRVEALDGRLTVESARGSGTTVTATIPLSRPPG